jgi:hypothetical protein
MRLAGVVLLAAVLSGCGSTTGSSLEEAADATAADTSRFEVTYHLAALGDQKEVQFGAEGAFDYPNERAVMTVSGEIPLFGEEIRLEEARLLGRTSYTRWTVKGKSYWLKQLGAETSGDPIEQLIPFPGSSTKPTDVLTRVLAASEKNEVLGEEEVRGVDTTHYRAGVSVAKLVEQLPKSDRPEGDVPQRLGALFVPVDIWIDDESRLRRIKIRQPEDPKNGNAATTLSADLFDYGVEVDVEPPPAGETISQDEFDRLTGSLGLAPGSGEGEAPKSPKQLCEWAREELPRKEAEEICAAATDGAGEEP